jgi:hypothetical protein
MSAAAIQNFLESTTVAQIAKKIPHLVSLTPNDTLDMALQVQIDDSI